VRWIYLLGKFVSSHTTQVVIYYSDGTTQTENYIISSADEPYLIRIKPTRQKDSSFYLRIRDTVTSGEGCRLYALALDIMKKSKIPLKAAKTK
jgi:hypothetical protein